MIDWGIENNNRQFKKSNDEEREIELSNLDLRW
jgi:hypothetical protein